MARRAGLHKDLLAHVYSNLQGLDMHSMRNETVAMQSVKLYMHPTGWREDRSLYVTPSSTMCAQFGNEAALLARQQSLRMQRRAGVRET